MSELFKQTINNAAAKKQAVIIEKNWQQYLFGIPPIDDFSTLNQAYFYKDTGENFKRTGLIGLDIRLLIGNALFFYLAHIVVGDVPLALLFTFVQDGLVRFVRNWLGEANISKKTMIDERFLI